MPNGWTSGSRQDSNVLFSEMSQELASHGSEIAFTQLRVSAERLIVPLCGLAVERYLNTSKLNQYHVYLERKLPQFKKGPVDLVLAPPSGDGRADWSKAYCFEFKMVWLRGLKDNVSGLKKDIEKLGAYDRGYVVGILFSFDGGPSWAPYAHKGDMGQLVEKVVSGVGKPVYEGEVLPIANHEAEGKLKLVSWAASAGGLDVG